MKKETLLEIILGTIGGLIFAIGMCMCLIPEWNMFRTGVVVTIIGFIVLLGIIPVYRSAHPKKEKEHKKIEETVVGGYKKVEDKFVDKFLRKAGETIEEAKERIKKEQEELAKKNEEIVNGGK